jgi:putative NIF3 family GTP cyclohydrolase 1 type 2
MRIREVADIIEAYAPFSGGVEGDELGLLVGDPQAEVAGVVTCWSPTLAVLEAAVAQGANLVIGHEPLTWQMCGRDPEARLKWYDERHPSAKIPNMKRMAFILGHHLTVYRYHSNWDWAPRYGMVDMLASALELGRQVGGQRITPVYQIAPLALAEFVERTREKLGLGPIRVVGDLKRPVSRVAICHGGFGQMFTFPELAVEGGADVAIFGEMLDYTMRYCVETDLAAVELGHYQSENPGMIGMADFLRERLPRDIPVRNVPSGEPWSCV